jgi:hypothetical protein
MENDADHHPQFASILRIRAQIEWNVPIQA